jgi:hypothetical protein
MNQEQRIRMKQKFADAGEQSALTNLEQLPSRIRHYLLEWKDCHLEEYCRNYGELKLRDLTKRQLHALFYYATSKDFSLKSWED